MRGFLGVEVLSFPTSSLLCLYAVPPSQFHVNCQRNRHVFPSTLLRRLLADSAANSCFCSAVLSLSRLDKINDWLGPRNEPTGLCFRQVWVAVEKRKLFVRGEENRMNE
jgi:hypothetical protein